jgi:hypothetical protein
MFFAVPWSDPGMYLEPLGILYSFQSWIIGSLLLVSVLVLQAWVGLRCIARKQWALWAGLVLQLPYAAYALLFCWLAGAQIGESDRSPDLMLIYSGATLASIYWIVPVVALVLALHAYHWNRDALSEGRTGARQGDAHRRFG